MKERLFLVLFWALVLHVIVSAAIILDLPFLSENRLAKVYKTHLLPGPFFTDSRIADTYSLSVSWKANGEWSSSISPAKEYFNRYHLTLNPTDLYISRLNRTLQLTLPDSSGTDIRRSKEFILLKRLLNDHYIPKEADSVRVWIVRKRAENLVLTRDSVCIEILQ